MCWQMHGSSVSHVLLLQSPKWDAGEPFVWDPSVRPVDCEPATLRRESTCIAPMITITNANQL